MNEVRCADVTCSAVSCMSTGELHELVYAPHTRRGPLREASSPSEIVQVRRVEGGVAVRVAHPPAVEQATVLREGQHHRAQRSSAMQRHRHADVLRRPSRLALPRAGHEIGVPPPPGRQCLPTGACPTRQEPQPDRDEHPVSMASIPVPGPTISRARSVTIVRRTAGLVISARGLTWPYREAPTARSTGSLIPPIDPVRFTVPRRARSTMPRWCVAASAASTAASSPPRRYPYALRPNSEDARRPVGAIRSAI